MLYQEEERSYSHRSSSERSRSKSRKRTHDGERCSDYSRHSDADYARDRSHSHRSSSVRSRSKSRERTHDERRREDRSRRSQSILSRHEIGDRKSRNDPGRSREESNSRRENRERDGKNSTHMNGHAKPDAEKPAEKTTEERVDSNKVVEDSSKSTMMEPEYEDEEPVMSEFTEFLEDEEEDIEKIKEQSRLRRQAILQKYQKQIKETGVAVANGTSELKAEAQKSSLTSVNSTEVLRFESTGFGISSSIASTTAPSTIVSSISSTLSEQNNAMQENTFSCHALPPAINSDDEVNVAVVPNGVAVEKCNDLSEGSPKVDSSTQVSAKRKRSPDMFSDDLFSDSPTFERRQSKPYGSRVEVSGLMDNWDDAEGYYTFRVGEILDGKYEVISSLGKGVFSTVVKAKNLKPSKDEPNEVAIKIIRNNETMYKAGHQELVILRKLAGQDKEDRRHCVRLMSSFEHRNHLCLVFESLSMNLREVLKKFGRNIGINLRAVEAYAKHLLIALKHLRNCGVLHCDIKPDNMLVNDNKNVLKLADFGSAMFNGENEITPYLVSRFYRAPEIMLGLPYDHSLDMWSVGCSLYELYTGKMLFPGRSNNEMLKLHMELKGPFPRKMLKKAAFLDQHFDSDYNFCSIEEDPVSTKVVKRIISNVKPKEISSLISSAGVADEDRKRLSAFRDLLDKIFVLDPDKRITVSQALTHPFITGKL